MEVVLGLRAGQELLGVPPDVPLDLNQEEAAQLLEVAGELERVEARAGRDAAIRAGGD